MSLQLGGNEILQNSYRFLLEDSSGIGEARRFVAVLAEEFGMSEVRRGRLAIIVNEIGSNLMKYSKGGKILVRSLTSAASPSGEKGIEIVSLDRGPGIEDLTRSMMDGFSTGGTLGTGLGAIKRLSDEFDIYSNEKGTCLVSVVYAADERHVSTSRSIVASAIAIPINGERVNGDGYCLVEYADGFSLLMSDGLGHGPDANQATLAAADIFRERAGQFTSVAELIQLMHQRLRSTRGAAVFVVKKQNGVNELEYGGVGNVRAVISKNALESRPLISQNGTAGLQIRQPRIAKHPIFPGEVLILATDGLGTRFDLASYNGLRMHHPAIIAAVLYRDFARGSDDVTVFAGRIQ